MIRGGRRRESRICRRRCGSVTLARPVGSVGRVLLAQLNIGLPVTPLTEPQLAGFVEALEPVNALADAAPGFVWRLQTEDGDATAIRPFADERLLVNMSVWRSLE